MVTRNTTSMAEIIVLLHIRTGKMFCTSLGAPEHQLHTLSSQQWSEEDDKGNINGCSG